MEIEALLERAEVAWRRGGEANARAAAGICDEVLRRLPGRERARRARVWLRRGQFLESIRSPGALREAVRSQEAGLQELAVGAASPWRAGDNRADLIHLRALLWMNRGNAVLALGEAESAREAVRSYATTLALLGEMALANGDVLAVERAAMAGAAWLNRAAAARLLAEQRLLPAAEEGRALERAIHELARAAESAFAPARRNLAGAWLNRAAWCERSGDIAGARKAWRTAANGSDLAAADDAVACETGLRARHALCVEAARRVAAGERLSEADEDELVEHVETGLAAFERLRGRALPAGAVATADRLFEFGAWFWRTRRPRLLAAFLARHAATGGPGRITVARTAAELARQEVLLAGFSELMSDAGAEPRARLRELAAAEARLAGRPEACHDFMDTRTRGVA